MANVSFPTAPFKSPVAIPGKTGLRDDHVWSAVTVTHAAQGNVNAFTGTVGQSIQTIGTASGSTAVQTFQKTFSQATTNLTQSGQVGSNIGDIAIRDIGIQIQPTFQVASATGVANATYGASQQEVAEILNKMSFTLNLINRPMSNGTLWMYPSPGGAVGSIAAASTSGTAAGNLASVVGNGNGKQRALEVMLYAGRADNLTGIFSVAGGDSLSFSSTSTSTGGQPTLIWVALTCYVSTDLVG